MSVEIRVIVYHGRSTARVYVDGKRCPCRTCARLKPRTLPEVERHAARLLRGRS